MPTRLILSQNSSDLWVLPEGERVDVFGSNMANAITVAAGSTTVFQGLSANSQVTFQGKVADYHIFNSGATVYFTHILTGAKVSMAATVGEKNIVFSDLSAPLRIADGAIKIGSQKITSTASAIVTENVDAPSFGKVDDTGTIVPTRMLMSSDTGLGWVVPSDETLAVYGNSSANVLTINAGANVELDPSFAGGGDQIIINAFSSTFSMRNSGATVVFTDNSSGKEVFLPAGVSGTTVQFIDGSAQLKIANGAISLGDQKLTTTNALITAISPPVVAEEQNWIGGTLADDQLNSIVDQSDTFVIRFDSSDTSGLLDLWANASGADQINGFELGKDKVLFHDLAGVIDTQAEFEAAFGTGYFAAESGGDLLLQFGATSPNSQQGISGSGNLTFSQLNPSAVSTGAALVAALGGASQVDFVEFPAEVIDNLASDETLTGTNIANTFTYYVNTGLGDEWLGQSGFDTVSNFELGKDYLMLIDNGYSGNLKAKFEEGFGSQFQAVISGDELILSFGQTATDVAAGTSGIQRLVITGVPDISIDSVEDLYLALGGEAFVLFV